MSMTAQEAIHKISLHLCRSTDLYNRALANEYTEAAAEFKRMMDSEQMAIDALREKAERENPQPLTLEELRQYERLPVFLVIENLNVKIWVIIDFSGDERTRFSNGFRLSNDVYGITWIAYRHKPKEGQQ